MRSSTAPGNWTLLSGAPHGGTKWSRMINHEAVESIATSLHKLLNLLIKPNET
jgi:hypothetical protein